MHRNNFSASIPTATNMAVSGLRLTIVWGLLVLILTCQAGKYFKSQLMLYAVVSHDWRKSVALIWNMQRNEGNLGHRRKSTGLGDRGRFNKKQVGFVFKCASVTASILSECMKFRMIFFLISSHDIVTLLYHKFLESWGHLFFLFFNDCNIQK